jgi:hypothetical protein
MTNVQKARKNLSLYCEPEVYYNVMIIISDLEEQLKIAQEKIKQYEEMIDAIPCTCDIAYTSRKLVAPDCPRCNYIYDPEEEII